MAFAATRRILEIAFVFFFTLPVCRGEDHLVRSLPDAESAQQVQIVLEAQGELIPWSSPRESAPKSSPVPVRLKGEFSYVERAIPGTPDLHARWYQQATAEIVAGDRRETPQLRSDHPWIAFHRQPARTDLYSPRGGHLTQDERELLDVAAPSGLLERLLPTVAVSVGSHWKLSDQDVADLLNWEAVSEQSIDVVWAKREEGQAQCDLSGSATGMSEAVLAKSQLEGTFRVDLTTQRVTWLALKISETRTASRWRPGVSITARLRLRREPTPMPDRLNSAEIVNLKPLTEPPAVVMQPDHREFQIAHRPEWVTTLDRRHRTLLELVQEGESIAQCSVTPLPDLPIGKTVTAAEFRQDIEAALGQNLQRIVDTSDATDAQRSVLRVVVAGQAESVPIQWIYCHVTSAEGRRAVLIFTLRQDFASRFAASDLELIEGLTFADSATPPVANASAAPLPSDAPPVR